MSRSSLHDWEYGIERCCKENLYFEMLDIAEDIYDTAYERGKNNKESMWIPCSERLPSKDGDAYLVTDYCPLINHIRTRIAYCYANKDGFWSNTPKGYEVIAWMPLPMPYREGREDYELATNYCPNCGMKMDKDGEREEK